MLDIEQRESIYDDALTDQHHYRENDNSNETGTPVVHYRQQVIIFILQHHIYTCPQEIRYQDESHDTTECNKEIHLYHTSHIHTKAQSDTRYTTRHVV